MALMILRSLKEMDEAREAFFEEARDYTSAKLGMWLFILSELLLFRNLIASVSRWWSPTSACPMGMAYT